MQMFELSPLSAMVYRFCSSFPSQVLRDGRPQRRAGNGAAKCGRCSAGRDEARFRGILPGGLEGVCVLRVAFTGLYFATSEPLACPMLRQAFDETQYADRARSALHAFSAERLLAT